MAREMLTRYIEGSRVLVLEQVPEEFQKIRKRAETLAPGNPRQQIDIILKHLSSPSLVDPDTRTSIELYARDHQFNNGLGLKPQTIAI